MLYAKNDATKASVAEYKHLVNTIPNAFATRRESSSEGRIVVLTGSTGALGSYILQVLLDSKTVSHIYCLNRASNSESLQLDRNKTRNLQTHFPTERVTFITVDLSKEYLGLGPDTYGKIRDSATDIIHNAWPVNFNFSLAAFKPHLLGVINIITLAATAQSSPSVLFISSISSIANLEKRPLPEEVVTDVLAPLPMGYAESKYLAEHIFDYAAHKIPSLAIGVARVGQIAGPVNRPGLWNKQEWFPSLALSSLHLGMIPESLGNSANAEVDWVPIDLLAITLVELSNNHPTNKQENGGAKFFHPMNPQPMLSASLLQVVATTLFDREKKKITPVPFNTWLQGVRSEAMDLNRGDVGEMLKVNPAIKLIAFYEGLAQGKGWPVADISEALKASKQLRALKGIESKWIENWVKGWLDN